MYWELDMLWAYQKVQEIAAKKLPTRHEFFAMQEEMGREIIFENNCRLLFNKETGRIQEEQMPDFTIGSLDIDSFINALPLYVKDHVQEIASKTFRVQNARSLQENRILNHTKQVCEYFKMELQRYGRNCSPTKAKLISAYQVYFLASNKLGIAPVMEKTMKAQTPAGLRRAKNTISSCYSNSKEKDPLCLQLICMWTDYQTFWNAQGSFFALKWLKNSILALNTMLAVDYRYGMPDIQLHMEKILFATIETLIPDEDGETQLEECIKELSNQGYQIRADFSKPSLLTFGKFCKLFNTSKVACLIRKGLDDNENKRVFFIELNAVTDNTFRIHSPTLCICHYKANDAYILQRFDNMNWKMFCLANY